MTANYASTLRNIFQAIAPHSSESDVEKKIIAPLLQILGYSHTDWEPQAIVGKSKLDFLVLPPTSAIPYAPYLVIEAKAANKNIDHNVWQINKYMRQTSAILGLLTNGYQFRLLYNYNQKPTVLLDYSQNEFIENFHSFDKILCKQTCLEVYQELYQNEQQLRLKFINSISQLFPKDNNFASESKKDFPSATKLEKASLITEPKKERQAMIITVFNNKGGVGKTTTTINLAAALNKLGKRVLLVDIDAQANLTMGLGIDPLEDVERHGKKDITHLLTEPKTSLEETIIRKNWDDIELDIVPSHIRLSDMEAELIMRLDIDRVLAKKLKKYRTEYDYILIDPPPSFGKANNISLMASSAVLIPTQLAPYPIRALEYVINRAMGVDQSRDEPLPILGIAVSMYNRAATKVALSMTQQIVDVISKIPNSPNVDLFPQDTWIPNLTIISTTPNKGYPICFAEFDKELSSKDKETAQDAFNCYMKLAKHLISVTKEKE